MTGAALPELSEDPVVSFCLKEVIAVAAGGAKKMAAKKQEVESWKNEDTSHLEGVG